MYRQRVIPRLRPWSWYLSIWENIRQLRYQEHLTSSLHVADRFCPCCTFLKERARLSKSYMIDKPFWKALAYSYWLIWTSSWPLRTCGGFCAKCDQRLELRATRTLQVDWNRNFDFDGKPTVLFTCRLTQEHNLELRSPNNTPKTITAGQWIHCPSVKHL